MCHRSRVCAQTCSVVNKVLFKALVCTLCEDKSPGCAIPFSDISLSVCLFTCVYMMFVALSMCLQVGAGSVGGSRVPMIALLLAPRWVCR